MAKEVQLAIRMSKELRDAIQRAAVEDGRPMSGYIERAVIRALRQDGHLREPGAKQVKDAA